MSSQTILAKHNITRIWVTNQEDEAATISTYCKQNSRKIFNSTDYLIYVHCIYNTRDTQVSK